MKANRNEMMFWENLCILFEYFPFFFETSFSKNEMKIFKTNLYKIGMKWNFGENRRDDITDPFAILMYIEIKREPLHRILTCWKSQISPY